MAEEMDKDVDVWKQVFQELMQEVKPRHKWTITQDNSLLPGVLSSGWMQYQQKTFARFQCSSCSRSWASGHVLVLFHIHWSRKKRRGQVKMRVFSQRCKKCPEPPFEIPEFRHVNITRLLNNLVFKILKKCYREEFEQVEEIPAVEDISLEGPHDSNNCEACLQGFCAQGGLGLTSKSRMSPEPPTSSKLNGDPSIAAAFIHVTAPQPPTKVAKTRVSTEDPKAYTMETHAKVSHTPKPSTIPTQATPQSASVLSTSSKLSGPPRVTATSISVPGSQPPTKVAKTRVSTEDPKASAFIKTDPNTSYTSRPAAVPVLANQWMSAVLSTRSSLTVEPMVTASCVSSPCWQPPTKATKTRASTEDPKASYLTKTDPKSDSKVRHTLDPSTAPTPSTYWPSPRSGFPPGFGNRMPPPTSSQTAENTAASGTLPKIPKASTSSSSFAAPTTQNPPRDHQVYQVELHPSHEPCCGSNCTQCCLCPGECCPSHEPCCCYDCMECCLQSLCSCRKCLFLIFVIIAVLLIVKNII